MITVTSLDDTPDGWAEELICQFSGWDQAQQVVHDRAQNARSGPVTWQGKPVYGMQGAVLLDGGPKT